jgi:hypothetical protein
VLVRRCISPPSLSTSLLRYESRSGRVNFDAVLIRVHSYFPPIHVDCLVFLDSGFQRNLI